MSKKLIVIGEDSILVNKNPKRTSLREFIGENYPTEKVMLREKYLSWFPLFKIGMPCFLDESTADHHFDIENIASTIKRNNIDKKELSLIIFDAHTDMYKLPKQNSLTKPKINMANWVLHLLEKDFSDISIVGVSDFTRSSVEIEEFEYWRFQNKVSFFLGEDFKKERDFNGPSYGKVCLRKINEFKNKKLRKYSFISLDCDVSSEFSDMNPAHVGYLGDTKIQDVCDIINHIKEYSSIAGFSMYGVFPTAFTDKQKQTKKVLDLILT